MLRPVRASDWTQDPPSPEVYGDRAARAAEGPGVERWKQGEGALGSGSGLSKVWSGVGIPLTKLPGTAFGTVLIPRARF